MENGNLFNFLRQNKIQEIKFIKKTFLTICQAIQYIHSFNIIHRDIKPENILLDKNNKVKLCDFGWSAKFSDNRKTFCGTYEYMAPEVFQNKPYDYKVDIWSLGILLYELFHNYSPFKGQSVFEIFSNIKNNKIKFKKNVPLEAQDLILLILKFNPKKRPSIQQIFNHSFLRTTLSKRRSNKRSSRTRKNKSYSNQQQIKKYKNSKANSIDQFTTKSKDKTQKKYHPLNKSKQELYKMLSPSVNNNKLTQVQKFFENNKQTKGQNLVKEYFTCKNKISQKNNLQSQKNEKFYQLFSSQKKENLLTNKNNNQNKIKTDLKLIKIDLKKSLQNLKRKRKLKSSINKKSSLYQLKNAIQIQQNQQIQKYPTRNNSLQLQCNKSKQIFQIKNQKILLRKLMQKNLEILQLSQQKKKQSDLKKPHFFLTKATPQKKMISPNLTNKNLLIKFHQLIFSYNKFHLKKFKNLLI